MKYLLQIIKYPMGFNPLRIRSQRLATKSNELDEFASNQDTKIDDSFDIAGNLPEAEEQMEQEKNFREKVERMRDVSRFSKLSAALKYKNSIPTYSNIDDARYVKSDPSYFRKLYSKHGKESGVEPGLAWPNKKELNDLIHRETELELSLEQKINVFIERKLKEINSIEKMEKDTDDALKKMPKQIETFYQRSLKKEEVLKEKQIKRQEIMDQAREYYGFEVDLRDARIQEMVKKLQEEKKAAERQKKKEEEKKKSQTNLLQQKLKESDKLIKNLKEDLPAAQ